MTSMDLLTCLQVGLEAAEAIHSVFKHYVVKCQELNFFARKYDNGVKSP
jgi:hypothetical protein